MLVIFDFDFTNYSFTEVEYCNTNTTIHIVNTTSNFMSFKDSFSNRMKERLGIDISDEE